MIYKCYPLLGYFILFTIGLISKLLREIFKSDYKYLSKVNLFLKKKKLT